MKQHNDFTIGKALLIIFSLVFFLFTSCKNPNDKEENVPEAVKQIPGDSASVTITHDSSSTTTTTTSTNSTAPVPVPVPVGKPNPAKKGGKGKATVHIPPATAAEKMEMDKEGVYTRADVMPSYPGGEKALVKFMEDNIEYPQAAIDDGVEGTVRLSFAVDENGKIYTPVLKSEKIGYGLEEEAMRVVKKMPKWNPGSIKGKNVKTRFEIPVTYVIQ